MRKVKKLIIALIAIGIIYGGVVFSLILSAAKEEPQPNADSLIILGAQVRGTPAVPSPVLKERLDTALTYIEDNPNTQIVVCGGQGADESDSEANVMATYLIEHGVPDTNIIREDDSTRTMENLMNAEHETTLGKTVIVSNDFHIYRAKMLANRIGIKEVSGLAAKSETSAKYVTYAREVIALGYGLVFDW
ncbi:YdcF family protein [Vagococcus sp. BWB3-3]|uniref:YdcF family protein n=1 Tax=Vagococcus allomyrinae TaxID=2794353 RepID=A0A940SXZ0_9ENTE|nr:YdcF family protein [Vagococcus allomyrinae]MBP1043856.1 YdcF family protein [Vagococcus allomyrinae]